MRFCCGSLWVLVESLGADFGADFGCGFWCGFWLRMLVRIFGADFGTDFSTGCADFGCGFLADFFQKAPNCRTVHFPKIPPKSTPKIQPPFRTPEEAFGRRLSADRHAKGSEPALGWELQGLTRLLDLAAQIFEVQRFTEWPEPLH